MARRKNRRAQVYAKRKALRHVSASQVRKMARKSQLKMGIKTIQMKAVVSQRGRTHAMEAALPGMPETSQDVLMASTAIKRFKYDLKTKTLKIWFVNGGAYNYFDVPESIVLNFAQAQSKGRFFVQNIRNDYKFAPA